VTEVAKGATTGPMRRYSLGPPLRAWKLLRMRRDGTLGPLFIGRRLVIPTGEWLRAEMRPTRGYAPRPGWHATAEPCAPHLSMKGRVWMQVELDDVELLVRPASQGGTWYTAKWMRVLPR